MNLETPPFLKLFKEIGLGDKIFIGDNRMLGGQLVATYLIIYCLAFSF